MIREDVVSQTRREMAREKLPPGRKKWRRKKEEKKS